MHALIVDDSDTMTGLQRAVLERLGYTRITHAPDREHAIDALQPGDEPEMILIDGTIGGVSGGGAALARSLRELGCRAPIVMISPHADEGEVARALRAGADGYVVKPFTPDLLFQRVRESARRTA